MSSLVPRESATPQPLPSLPPSPTEEDLSRAHAWSDSEQQHGDPNAYKGKGKTKFVEDLYDDASNGTSQLELSTVEAYPPVNDDEAETRRVEENLKRWEATERQRRKAARESASSTVSPTAASLVGDVTRRASLLWPGRKTQNGSHGGLGAHTALKSRDSVDVVPLEPFDVTPPVSTATSPNPSLRGESPSENPFSHPEDMTSPFDDAHQQTAVMSASSVPPLLSSKSASKSKHTPERPILEASSSFPQNPPPPLPLGLPPPRTPPPPRHNSPTARPPTLTPPPDIVQPVSEPEYPPETTRWWHDWLCGCGEGPDRGGDHQAGRTNPFE